MKKLVIKTTCITLASLIVAFALFVGAAILFAPGWVGGIFDGVGNYSASVFFYEKQYEKTGDIDDLNTLVLKIDIKNDSSRASKYFGKMVEHQDFKEFCNSQDGGSDISAKEYYFGCYVLALAYNGKLDDAIDKAKDFVGNTYTENNPFRLLVADYAVYAKAKEFDEDLHRLDTALADLSVLDLTDQARLQNDRIDLENLIKN